MKSKLKVLQGIISGLEGSDKRSRLEISSFDSVNLSEKKLKDFSGNNAGSVVDNKCDTDIKHLPSMGINSPRLPNEYEDIFKDIRGADFTPLLVQGDRDFGAENNSTNLSASRPMSHLFFNDLTPSLINSDNFLRNSDQGIRTREGKSRSVSPAKRPRSSSAISRLRHQYVDNVFVVDRWCLASGASAKVFLLNYIVLLCSYLYENYLTGF